MEQCLLALIVSPSIENAVIDWLLERDDIPGFNSAPINGHGTSTNTLTLQEQVAGHRRQVIFRMCLPEQVARTVLEEVRQSFHGSGMHYWLMPVLASGHIE
jgi:hypothetical protein